MIIPEACEVPEFYGVAYYDPMRRVVHAYPVPFHWVVRYGRQFWYWVRFAGVNDRWSREINKAYRQGREDQKQALLDALDSLRHSHKD